MKRWLLILALWLINTSAHAAGTTCDALASVVRYFPSGFAEINGVDFATVFLPQADDCWVDEAAYFCVWNLEPEYPVQEELGRFAEDVRACYPQFEYEPNLPEDFWVTGDGMAIYGTADPSDNSITLSIGDD
ncbi:MAG TPA: hypothetical protein VJL84_03380 [Kiloniellales bacterium]|nr:hypothetical protein [Kiloniellales bacterium]